MRGLKRDHCARVIVRGHALLQNLRRSYEDRPMRPGAKTVDDRYAVPSVHRAISDLTRNHREGRGLGELWHRARPSLWSSAGRSDDAVVLALVGSRSFPRRFHQSGPLHENGGSPSCHHAPKRMPSPPPQPASAAHSSAATRPQRTRRAPRPSRPQPAHYTAQTNLGWTLIDSIDPEALGNVTQRPGRAIVRRLRSWVAHDHRPVTLVADPDPPWAPEAPLDIDLAAPRADEVSLAVLVKLDASHARPAFLRWDHLRYSFACSHCASPEAKVLSVTATAQIPIPHRGRRGASSTDCPPGGHNWVVVASRAERHPRPGAFCLASSAVRLLQVRLQYSAGRASATRTLDVARSGRTRASRSGRRAKA